MQNCDEVVLDFPYKDCVLAGGQRSEDGNDCIYQYDEKVNATEAKKGAQAQSFNKKIQKRQEVFFNNVIATDEIDRLLDPKALVHWKKFTADGVSAPEHFNRDEHGTITDNLIIKGNNLLALHSLKQEFAGKVKLIYIDPPYNTGNDGFKYNDNFNHSTWLTFMKNRLEVAKELLQDDGVIFVQCDDNEQAYLKVLMDEIFGRENFINTISVKMSTASGLKMSHINKKIIKTKEHIIVFAIDKQKIQLHPVYFQKDNYDNEYGFYIDKNNSDDIDKWEVKKLKDVLKDLGIGKMDINNEHFRDFYIKNKHLIWARGRHHNIPKDIYELSKQNKNKIYRYGEGDNINYAYRGRRCAFLDKTVKKCITREGGIKEDIATAVCDFWNFISTSTLFNEGCVDFTNGKKPEDLLKVILEIATQENDLVLDFCLGSGTTAAVAHKMNRQYIGVDQMDYIEDIAVERLKKVIDGEQGGISKAVNWQGGGEFIYCELAEFNQAAKAIILSTENSKNLTDFWDVLYEKYFLQYNVASKNFIEKQLQSPEFQALSLDEQKAIFCDMLDNNQLYVNQSEIDDAQFNISEQDRQLSKAFYGEDL